MTAAPVKESRKQMAAVRIADRQPNTKPTKIFCIMYCLCVIGRISLISATPSSFSEIMFMALKVQPMNIATISVMAIKIF